MRVLGVFHGVVLGVLPMLDQHVDLVFVGHDEVERRVGFHLAGCVSDGGLRCLALREAVEDGVEEGLRVSLIFELWVSYGAVVAEVGPAAFEGVGVAEIHGAARRRSSRMKQHKVGNHVAVCRVLRVLPTRGILLVELREAPSFSEDDAPAAVMDKVGVVAV